MSKELALTKERRMEMMKADIRDELNPLPTFTPQQMMQPLMRYETALVKDVMSNKFIPQDEKELIMGMLNAPTIAELMNGNQDAVYDVLDFIFFRTVWDSGFNISEEDQVELNVAIQADIFKDFKHFTLYEVYYAFRYGIRGTFGEFMGMNVRTLYGFLKRYKETTKTRLAQTVMNMPKTDNKLLSFDEKEHYRKEWLDIVIKDWKRYLITNETTYDDIGQLFYKYLRRNGLYNLTEEQEKDCILRAKKIIKIKNSKKTNQTLAVRIRMKDLLKRLEEKEKSQHVKDLILMHAYKLAIPVVFKNYKAKGIDLEELINEVEHKRKERIRNEPPTEKTGNTI